MKNKGKRKILLSVLLTFAIILGLFAVAGAVYIASICSEKLDLSLFHFEGQSSVSKIFVNENGEWVEWEEERILGERNFEFVSIESVPRTLVDAVVAIEDKRFYEHNGVDWYRTAGAMANYFFRFGGSFGASTVTQQVVKNVTGRDEVSIERKIREIAWALRLEREFDKSEIMEMYLNVINLGSGCYGVKSAARYYFSKDVSELTLLESACLVAITNNPSYYNPVSHPQHNRERRDLIIYEMYAQGKISEEEYENAYGAEIVLNLDTASQAGKIHSWYVDMVIDDVIADLCEQYGLSTKGASMLVFGGGVEIYIQINREIQKIMEDYYENTANFPSGEGAQSAMIIIDSQNGDILGVVGAIGKKEGNRVQSYATDTLRPPGSTIKPLSVYAPALERGVITYASVYDDVPVKFYENSNGTYTLWPKNANGVYHGLSTMSYAVANSTNTVPVKILGELGLSHSFYFLRDYLELDALIEEGEDTEGHFITDMDYAALALGQLNYGISVRDITSAYSIFADNGIFHSSRSYSLVKDSQGEVLLEKEAINREVMSDGNAEIMTKLLSEVAHGGTANDLTVKNKVAIACKTGTSQDNKDRWCIGYTPSFICGVWYGYEYPREIPRAEKNHYLDAFDTVITRIYDSNIYSAYKDRKFEESAGLVVTNYCMDSGGIPTQACIGDARGSRVKQGYFVKGTEPKELCTVHTVVEYDAVCGGVATVFTPQGHIKEVGMIQVERVFPMQIIVSDAQYVYKKLSSDTLPSFLSNEPFFAYLEDGKKKKYFGISAGKTQFNRISTAHFTLSDLVFERNILKNQH